jgi:mycothiol system anti-sigma-R factor
MDCEEVLVRLWEYLDEELAPEEAEGIRAHLLWCRDCFPTYCCNRAFLQLLARLKSSCSAPPALVSSLTVRLRSL